MSKTRSHYSGPKIWNQDRQGQFLKRPSQGQGRGATDLGREDGGDDATKAGGGNLHRGRGATAWGREDGGDDATKAGGGNLHRGWGATATV